MPGSGILVDIVLDAFGFKRRLQACGRRSRYAVGAAVAGDDRTSAAQRLSGGYGIRACRIVGAEAWKPRVAASSAKPPPMQKPATPTRPVQSSRPASQRRTASMSSNVVPRLRIGVRMHRGAPPAVYRSGATATKPAPAKRSVCWRTSSARPSCKPTPLGHRPLPSGGTASGPSAPRGTVAIADTWPRAGYFVLVASRGASRPPGCRSTLRCRVTGERRRGARGQLAGPVNLVYAEA